MYYGKVEICGVNTAKLKNLSQSEKAELLEKCKNGDATARQELIDGNLRLVLSIIQKFVPRCESADDLFQIGCIGLIKAIDNFNTDLDVQFSTYAVPMIIGEVRRYLRDNNTLRVSRSMRDLAYKALAAKQTLLADTSSEPTIEMIAEKLKSEHICECSESEIAEAMNSIVEPVSLFEPIFTSDGGDGVYLMDQISEEYSPDDIWTESIALRDAVKRLGEREKEIINKRYVYGKTQTEIAEEIGISQAQISRLEKAALDKLKKYM